MRMSDASRAASTGRAARARGFTLLEIVVVLAIMGLVAAVAVPSVIRGIDSWRRQAQVDALLDQAVECRRRAGHERDACRCRREELDARQRGSREQHADHRREDDERNHTRLGEVPELHPDGGLRLDGCVHGNP